MSFAALSYRQRDLWHGLITVADDQGRVLGVPANIRSEVWPYDDVTLEQVEQDLGALSDQGMVLIYQVKNKPILQVINWWKYQVKQWAGPSDWEPPAGWMDRCRYHGAGHKIILENWDQAGGFDYTNQVENDLVNQVVHDLDNSVNDSDIDIDIEVKEVRPEKTPALTALPSNLDGWLEQLKNGSNKPAILRSMIEALYPDLVDYPDFAYIGKVARQVGGAGRLASLLWEVVPRNPTGDILSYVQAMTRARKKNDEPAGFEGLREYANEQGWTNGD